MSKDAYASGLTWEQVFNGNHKPWATVADVFSAAESTGYEYAVYRGTLYYHSSLSGTPWLSTFLGPEALDEGAEAAAQLRDTLRKRDVKIEEMARGQDRLRRERDQARGTVAVDPLPKAPKKEARTRLAGLKRPSTQERIATALAVKAHRDWTLSMADVENAIIGAIEEKADDYQSFEWAPVTAGLDSLRVLVAKRTK